jgi:predicted DNA-binding transcriptional regulator YafY
VAAQPTGWWAVSEKLAMFRWLDQYNHAFRHPSFFFGREIQNTSVASNHMPLAQWVPMDRFTRIFKLHRILAGHRAAVSMNELQSTPECSRASVNRVIREMRDYLDALIEYDRELNGYRYAAQGHTQFELPGLWLSPSDLYALLVHTNRCRARSRDYWTTSSRIPNAYRARQLVSRRLRSAGARCAVSQSMALSKFGHFQHQRVKFQTIYSTVVFRRRTTFFYGKPRHTAILRFTSDVRAG